MARRYTGVGQKSEMEFFMPYFDANETNMVLSL